MRTLLLFRGAPGCGKSTYIDTHGLRQFALSADEIRLLCQSPQQNIDGSPYIGFQCDKFVWDTLFKILELRMQKGEFTVIDATNSKAIEMNKYKKLADEYRYRIFCIDMTNLPIEECKRRNAERIPLKRVPEEAIDKMYARFRTQKIPSGIKVIKPEELDKIWMKKIDLSNYRKVIHIGDIHGCNTVLQEYLRNGIEDDCYYIFVGDYLDRGIENVDVLKFLLSIKDKPNVYLLTGNHECMHKDTEVLTSEGWKYLKDINIDYDKVAQYDIDTCAISYEKPIDKTSHFEKEMIDIETFDTHQIVTSNHDIIYKNKKIKASDLLTTKNIINQNDIPCYGYFKQEDYDIDDNDLRFLVWIITDGTIVRYPDSIKKRIQFHFVRQDKIENLKLLLDSIGIKYSVLLGKTKKHRDHKQQDYFINIYGDAARHYDKILNYTKVYPEFFTKLSQRQFYIVLDELIKTDGRVLSEFRIQYSTIEKINADIIQQMCIKNNASCTIRYKDNSHGYNQNGYIYDITIKPYGMFPSYDVKINKIEYNDLVYCLQMPKGTMVTRYNGKVAITGNCHINKYAYDQKAASREFELVTKKQLDDAGVDKKELRVFFRKLGQCAWYTYGDKEVFVSHGGIATLPANPTLIASEQIIKGVGTYGDFETIADSWMNTMPDNCYQIHGHRNTKDLPVKVRERVFNLEGRVEFGGCLRVVELDNEGFHTAEIRNTVFRPKEEFDAQNAINSSDIATNVLAMRNNKYIQEKTFGPISSFNFTKTAFQKGIWDNQTIRARGLYIDTDSMKVTARGFDKFFEYKIEDLQDKIQFPATAYIKENGFLGIVSYNPYDDDLLITTKSSMDGDYAVWLKDIFFKKVTQDNRERLKSYIKENNVTFLFECIDIKHDPHVIEYVDDDIILLDVVANNLDFNHVSYETLQNLAMKFGLKIKTKAFEFSNWQEFYDWHQEVMQPGYIYNGHEIEGFVVEDSNEFMVKIKVDYYTFWKFMRSIAAETLHKGYIDRTGILVNQESNMFYGFVKKLYENTPPDERDKIPRDIISLRRMFYDDNSGSD